MKNKILCISILALFFVCGRSNAEFYGRPEKVNLEDIGAQLKNYDYRETKYQVEIIEILVQAEKENFPIVPLANKIKEGLAKDIGLKIIRDTVLLYKENMKRAFDLLNEFRNKGVEKDSKAEDSEIVISLGGFLSRGLGEDSLKELADRVVKERGNFSRLIALGEMFTDLKEKELKDDVIWTVVNFVVEQNIRNADVKGLVDSIYQKIDSGADIEAYVKELANPKPSRILIRK